MLSLKDEISSFRTQIQKLNLNSYSSLFQTHSLTSSKPSLNDVVTQNHFLAESLKMMGNVFLNYCWLNERVYSKIMDHQLSLHDSQAKFNNLTQTVERKLDDSLRTFKTLHEESTMQNRKNKEIVQVGLKSICEEIQTKVTDAQLTEKIREILRKYDQGDLLNEVQEPSQTSSSNMLISTFPQNQFEEIRAPSLQMRHSADRKVGKVSYDDYYRLKDEMQAHLGKLKKNIHDTDHQNHQNKEKIIHCAALLQAHQAQIKRNKSEVSKLQFDHKNIHKFTTQLIEKIARELQAKVSQQQWKRRLNLFQMRSIDPLRLQMNDSLLHLRNEIKKIKEETYLKTNSAQGQLLQFGKQLSDFKARVAKEVEDVAVLQLKFSQLVQRLHHQITEVNNNTDYFMQEAKKNGNEFQKNCKKQVAQLRNTILKLSNSVEQKAFKAIAKKIQSSFNCFQSDLMQSRDIIKSLTASMSLANEQINTMKDLLSRKANFSDVVHYIQSKADKSDFKQIRSRLNQNSQSHPVMVRQLSETIAARNEHSLIASPKRVIKTPRTEFIAPVTHRDRSTNSRTDLEGTARRLLVRENKKKVMKSYGSLISDLRN